jgi:hypothetical protein
MSRNATVQCGCGGALAVSGDADAVRDFVITFRSLHKGPGHGLQTQFLNAPADVFRDNVARLWPTPNPEATDAARP